MVTPSGLRISGFGGGGRGQSPPSSPSHILLPPEPFPTPLPPDQGPIAGKGLRTHGHTGRKAGAQEGGQHSSSCLPFS